MSTKRDYYEILGVNKNATEKEIKTAYRSLAKQYHPDKLKDGTSDQKMKELNEAYEILSNSEKRNIYDKYGRDAANGRAGSGGFDASGFEGFQHVVLEGSKISLKIFSEGSVQVVEKVHTTNRKEEMMKKLLKLFPLCKVFKVIH
ncbi:DnaJ domain-containing protein [Mycoplasmopsis cynos]|uniref:DnaJ domain-containing protein n=1 Tax=Mycoplasmopsis cynos TaxID=171284 RepID=UPI002205F226|nr:DnaJ domain-containing protein [Mycoplasmopsis cynos]UWV86349.1 DnaJ domain-containing protein [Mycoplasmopsis cynos]